MENIARLPRNEEGEKYVIGSIISEPKMLSSVSMYLESGDAFFDKKNKILYKKIIEMNKTDEDISLVTICGRLTEEDKVNGLDAYYVTGLPEIATESSAIVSAKQVYEKHLLRKIMTSSNKILESASNNDGNVYELLNSVHNNIGQLIDIVPGRNFDINQLVDDTWKSIEQGDKNIIKTGFDGFDQLAGGMTRGEITILGGRPGHGKTTTMVNLIKNCIDQGMKVLVFNREMTNVEMLKKILVLESGKLSYFNVRKGIISDLETIEELERTKASIRDKYNSEKFAMYDNVSDFQESASILRKFKPDVVFDDYIQLIVPPNTKVDRRLQLEYIVNNYKWLVKKNNCAAVLLSQLNRALEHAGAREPRMSDLAESGAIEQVAENILFVYYPYKVESLRNKFGSDQIKLIGSKVRYGTSGTSLLGFNGDKIRLYQSLEEMERIESNRAR